MFFFLVSLTDRKNIHPLIEKLHPEALQVRQHGFSFYKSRKNGLNKN